jgi:hypothetical protein
MRQDHATRDVTIPAAYWALEFDVPPRQSAPAEVEDASRASGGSPALPLESLLASALVTLEVALDVLPLVLGDWLDC